MKGNAMQVLPKEARDLLEKGNLPIPDFAQDFVDQLQDAPNVIIVKLSDQEYFAGAANLVKDLKDKGFENANMLINEGVEVMGKNLLEEGQKLLKGIAKMGKCQICKTLADKVLDQIERKIGKETMGLSLKMSKLLESCKMTFGIISKPLFDKIGINFCDELQNVYSQVVEDAKGEGELSATVVCRSLTLCVKRN